MNRARSGQGSTGPLIAAPLRIEALIVRSGARHARVHVAGMGPERARAAVRALREQPGSALLILGFCGALEPDAVPGEVVVADRLLGAGGSADRSAGIFASGSRGVESDRDRECARGRGSGQDRESGQDRGSGQDRESGRGRESGQDRESGQVSEPVTCAEGDALAVALEQGGLGVRRGAIVCVSRPALGKRRAELRERYGAVAVDMESLWLAAGAGSRPVAVVRAILDSPSHELLRPGAAVGVVRAAIALRKVAAALYDWQPEF